MAKLWSPAEDRDLLRMAQQGYTYVEIATQVHRTVAGVQHRITLLRNSPRVEIKERPCLKCRRNFKSEGSGNRICPTCTDTNSRVYSPTIHLHTR